MENETRLIFGLVLYFVGLTFLVTMFSAIAFEYGVEDVTSTNGIDGILEDQKTYPYTASPRFAGFSEFGFTDSMRNNDLSASVYRTVGGYVDTKEDCERFDGFTWGALISIGNFEWGDEWCTGSIIIDNYTNGEPFDEGLAYTVDEVCTLGALQGDKYLTDQFGCSWITKEIEAGSLRDADGYEGVWGAVKQIMFFNIDFGIENGFLNWLANFLVVGIPSLLASAYIIIVLRKLVGFT